MNNHTMHIVCLDLEGILIPEIWISVAEHTGIAELRLTTRDVPDYDALMKGRIGILKENNLRLSDIQYVIRRMSPLEGAREFLQTLRRSTQVIILSDTFEQFSRPFMEKLDWPTIFCNTLLTDDSGTVVGYTLRQADGKARAVAGLKSMGFATLAVGDSYNDIAMLKEAGHGVLFRPPENIAREYGEFSVVKSYIRLLAELRRFLGSTGVEQNGDLVQSGVQPDPAGDG